MVKVKLLCFRWLSPFLKLVKKGFEFHCLPSPNFIWADALHAGNRLFAFRIHGALHKSW
jgi:hypothetical protein